MSRTRCALSGPVAATPGTRPYQADGATSIKVPFAASATPSTTAIEIAGTTVSCVSPQGRDSEARCDMRRKFFFVAEEHTGNDSRALMPNEHLTAGDVGRVAREPCAFRVVQASMECGRMRARRGGVLADKSRRDANPAGVSLQRATRPLRPDRNLGA